MTSTAAMAGVLSPVVTPFTETLEPDGPRLVAHCKWLLANEVGLAVFGTNSAANSLSVAEKVGLLEMLVEAGIPAGRMMPGTGCCALPDSVELTRRAVNREIGEKLIEDATARAIKAGSTLLQLTMHKSRTDTARFYERLGFTPSHIGYKRVLS